MSKFSTYLGELIRRSGEPIARIAKNAGLERTSIHKALKDERILPYASLKKLTQYFQLTLPEARELNLCYDMLLQGEDAYYIHGEICQTMLDLCQLHFSSFGYQTDISGELPREARLIHGNAEVQYMLQAVLGKETDTPDAEICLNLNPEHRLSDNIVSLWRGGKRFTVYQIVAFCPESGAGNIAQQNIHRIRQLLPTALLSGGQYHAYYCFASEDLHGSLHALPYYVITPNYLITLSEDMSAAYIHCDPALISYYRRQFEKTVEECQSLVSYSADPFEVLSSYMGSTDQDSYYTVMTQPCIGRYYTREFIERYVKKELPYYRELVEMSVQRFSILRQLQSNYYTVFTESGLERFARDGIIADLPSALVLPIEPADRHGLLTALRQDIADGTVCGLIADPDLLAIPQYLTFTCDPCHGVHMYALDEFIGGGYTCNLHITAANLGTAFCDFIRFLLNSKYVYTREQTLAVLDRCIALLEKAPTGADNI